jgi:hypothetical protein
MSRPCSSRRLSFGTVLTVLVLATAPTAHAGSLEVVPTRSRGMGGALRGAAAGTSAPALNPSGLSLVRSYVIEGAYHYLQDEKGHLTQVAVSDSTSATNLGGGLSYTYATGSPPGGKASRHEGSFSLSFPFGDYVALGGSARYLKLSHTPTATNVEEKRSGFTFDAGLSVRPSQRFSLGLAAYGLKDMKDPQVPRAFGGGIVLIPMGELIIAGDAVLDQRTHDPALGNAWSFMGGAEYTAAGRFAVRAGGGHDGLREQPYASLGVSVLGEMGAIDAAGRLDLGSKHPQHSLYVGMALRLFVPSP